jgi:hypothetical protein
VSARHLKLIATGLAVLLLLWGGSELLSRGSDTVTTAFAVPALAPTDVDTVSAIKGADTIVLVKQSLTEWTVNGHRAALDAVSALFQALKDTALPELVAQDSSSFRRLGVDSAAGRRVRFRSGSAVRLELVVGSRGPDVQSAYVRRPGDTHVYLWRGRLVSAVDRPADEWRDRRIAALAPESLSVLTVERGKDRYTLQRGPQHWALNGAATDSAAVARYLERLRVITAAGFATPREVDSIKAVRPTRRLVVRGTRGSVVLTLAFDSTATGFVVRHLAGLGGEGATVYRMNQWDVDGLTPASRSLARPKS